MNALATALRCHPTFIAKVLTGRADFSPEQALAFAEYVSLTEHERQFFIDLVQRDRASDARTRIFFEKRVQRLREERLKLQVKLGETFQPSPEIQSQYYSSWIPQLIHMVSQTKGRHTVASIAEAYRLPFAAVEKSVIMLKSGGLVEEDDGSLRSLVDFMHIPNDSHLEPLLHQHWRMKTANDIAARDTRDALHFSGLMSIDREAAEKIRELLTTSIGAIKPIVAAADPQSVLFLSIDFYRP